MSEILRSINPAMADLLLPPARSSVRSLRQRREPTPYVDEEEERSLAGSLRDKSLTMIGAVGNLLDLPGSMARDVASSVVQGQFVNPFDQLMSPFSADNRTTGKELNRQIGFTNDDDSWGNAIGGFATEVLADPMTYMTLGGSALGKAGKAAGKAGLFDEIASVAARKQGKQLGQVGKREARLTTTLGDVAKFGSENASTKASELIKASPELADEAFGGMVGFGLPFMPPMAIAGQGAKSQAIARGMDTAGRAARYAKVPGTEIQPLNSLLNLFDAPGMGTKTPFGHALATEHTRAKDVNRTQIALDANWTAGELEKAGMLDKASADLIRAGSEGVIPINQLPKDLQPIVKRQRDETAAMPGRARKEGTQLTELTDDEIDHAARFLVQSRGHHGKRTSMVFNADDPSQMARLDFLRDAPGGTNPLKELFQDPAINQAIDDGMGLETVRLAVEAKAKGWLPDTWREYSPKHKKADKAGWVQKTERYKEIANWLSGLSKETREAGVWGNHPILDHQARRMAFEDSLTASNTVAKGLSQPGILVPLSAAANAGADGSMTVGEVLSSLKLNLGDVNGGMGRKILELRGVPVDDTALEVLSKMRLSKTHAEELQSIHKVISGPDAVNDLIQMVDSVTNYSKGMWTSVWPAFHVRNRLSGAFQNMALGIWSKSGDSQASTVLTGKVIKDASQKPWVIAEYQRRLAKDAAAGQTPPGQAPGPGQAPTPGTPPGAGGAMPPVSINPSPAPDAFSTLTRMEFGEPIALVATDNAGKEVGRLTYMPNGGPIDIFVEESSRRKGIGTALYDALEAAGGKLPTEDSGFIISSEARAVRAKRAASQKAGDTPGPGAGGATPPLPEQGKLAVAIRVPDTGEVIYGKVGETHGDLLVDHAEKLKYNDATPDAHLEKIEAGNGFIDSDGNFLTRGEAADRLGIDRDLASEELNARQGIGRTDDGLGGDAKSLGQSQAPPGQPWEMTREDFATTGFKVGDSDELIKKNVGSSKVQDILASYQKKYPELAGVRIGTWSPTKESGNLKDAGVAQAVMDGGKLNPKETWIYLSKEASPTTARHEIEHLLDIIHGHVPDPSNETFKRFRHANFASDYTHRQFVKQAISDGKQVPDAVLADYPDLARLAKSRATAPPAPPASVPGQPIGQPTNVPPVLDDEYATRIIGEMLAANGVVGKFEGNAVAVSGIANKGQSGDIDELLSGVGRPGVQTFSAGRTARKAIGMEPGTTLNPIDVRGVGGRTESGFGIAAAGEELGHATEFMNRAGPWITMMDRGYDAAEAAKKVGAAQVLYSNKNYTAFETQVMGRLFPFYKFSRGSMPVVIRHLMEKPGGPYATVIKGTNRAQSDGNLAPDYVRDTANIPIDPNNPIMSMIAGTPPEGTDRYLTGFGLMHEDVLAFGPSVRGAGLEALSRMNPFLKGPLEWATGQTFFQRGPEGGRDLNKLDPTVGRLVANVMGQTEQDDSKKFPLWMEQIVANSPIARATTTARSLTDPRKRSDSVPFMPGAASLLNTLSGVRVSDVSPGSKDAILRDMLTSEMQGAGAAVFERVYFSKEDLEKMTPEARANAIKLQGLANVLAKRSKERKAEKDAAKAKK